MEINGNQLQEKINNGEKVIVEMYATWCGPCKMLKPLFEKVAKENTSDVQMYTLDVDSNRDFAMKYGVRSVPTIKTFNVGEVTNTKVGVLSEGQIKELVTELTNG
jgi:thioredoxin 1